MVWTTPTVRVPRELIDYTDWNTDIVDNLNYLHARYGTLYGSFIRATNTSDLSGFAGPNLGNAQTANWNLAIPDDFSALVSAELHLFDSDAGTLTYSIDVQYSNPDNVENYNANTGSLAAQTLVTVSLRHYAVSFSSILTNIAAGDYLGVRFTRTTQTGGANGTKPLGIRLVYSRV